jgi:hypothetical protein
MSLVWTDLHIISYEAAIKAKKAQEAEERKLAKLRERNRLAQEQEPAWPREKK